MPDDLDILDIQRLQFDDRESAQALITRWFHERVGLHVRDVVLQPSEVSLNSVKGYAWWNDQRVFFKSHTESHSKVTSFYDSTSMIDAGYDIAVPIASQSALGTQVVLYDANDIGATMFDLVRQAETGSLELTEPVLQADRAEGTRLLDIYRNTARVSSAGEHAQAAIHQLFHHRLDGKRFDDYYGNGSLFVLPDGRALPIDELFSLQWRINGVDYTMSLRQTIDEALETLRPDKESLTVIGHGDAHPGNVIITNSATNRYFAPAFGGRHSPLLDAAKPLFHAVFARWMYFPGEVAREQEGMAWSIKDGIMDVQFSHHESPYRGQLHASKVNNFIKPLLGWMREQHALPDGQRPFDLALMCCPLLTVNPTDGRKYSPTVGLMGLAQAVQMGNGAALDLRRLGWLPPVLDPPTGSLDELRS